LSCERERKVKKKHIFGKIVANSAGNIYNKHLTVTGTVQALMNREISITGVFLAILLY